MYRVSPPVTRETGVGNLSCFALERVFRSSWSIEIKVKVEPASGQLSVKSVFSAIVSSPEVAHQNVAEVSGWDTENCASSCATHIFEGFSL